MELSFEMEKLDGVDESVAKLYTKNDDGKFILTGITGIASKARIDEFRNTNIELSEKLKAFKDIDPKIYKQMKTDIDEYKIRLEKSGELDEEQIEKLVSKRVDAMKTEFSDKEVEYKETINKLTKTNHNLVIGSEIKQASIDHGVADSAISDLTLRAGTVFTMDENGKPIGKDSDGQIIYDASGKNPISINEWVKGLAKTAPHFFKQSVRSEIPGDSHFKGDASKLSPTEKISLGLNG